MTSVFLRFACGAAAALPLAAAAGAQTLPEAESTIVDVELVLAVDVSWSMDYDEQLIQRDGYVAAFRDPELISALVGGYHGRVAVTYFEWASEYAQRQTVPWTVIDSAEAAEVFAKAIEDAPIARARGTSISAAISTSAQLIQSNEYDGVKRVIDVSGDGQNISGPAVEPIRDAVADLGIIINGLPLMMRPFEAGDLASYYEEHVIAGTGSFVIPVEDVAILASSIRSKLILEIAGGFPEEDHAELDGVTWGEPTP